MHYKFIEHIKIKIRFKDKHSFTKHLTTSAHFVFQYFYALTVYFAKTYSFALSANHNRVDRST